MNGKIIGSVIDLQDETEVSGLRRAVGNAFAAKNLLDYEADVDHTVERLLRAIRKARLVNGHAILQQFQVDFLMKAAFSRQTDYLETRRSTSAINGYSRLTHWSRWQSAPSLEWLFFKSPLCSAWYARRAAKPQAWTAMAIEEFNNRRNKKQPAAAAAGDDKPDLLAKFMSGGDRHRDTVSTETVLRMVSSTISAGFDSSAFTMMSILYMLLKNPPAKEKLQAELDDAVSAGRLSPPWPPRFTDVDRLPYLGAVIKESMRLSTFLVNSLEREVPAGGAEVAGAYLPTGTVVGVAIQIAHRDTGVFGKDADEFRPDRWLEADEKTRLLMERSVLSFGGGKRVCMGRHIAELEMKKVIPSLLLEFDVSLHQQPAIEDPLVLELLVDSGPHASCADLLVEQISLQDPNYVLEPLDKLSNFPKPFNIVCQDKA